MIGKDFENTSSQNDIKFLRYQLEDTTSKRERISHDLENTLREERDLKLRIHIAENGW